MKYTRMDGFMNGIQQAVGILYTSATILNTAYEARKALPVEVTRALGEALGKARTMLAGTQKVTVYRDLDAVKSLLARSYEESVPLSYTISNAMRDILCGVMQDIVKQGAPEWACRCQNGGGLCRKDNPDAEYIGTIDSPEFSEAGIEAIELWRVTDRKENPAVKGGVPVGAPGAFSQELTEHLRQMLKKVGKIGERVDELHAQRQARVPDWRDAQSAPNSGVLRDATKEDKPEGKPEGTKPGEPEIKTFVGTTKTGKKKVMFAIDGNTKCYTGSEEGRSAKPEEKPAPKKAKVSKGKPADGTAEVSGYFSPEETAELIEKIRAWLETCRDGHRLSDLMETIRLEFELSDGQLGELLGISDRLVCHVRHGRKSPFALARFTEVFGAAGGAKEG